MTSAVPTFGTALVVERFPVRGGERNLPERKRRFAEFDGNQIPLGAPARGTRDARAGALAGTVIEDFEPGIGIERPRAKHHRTVKVNSNGLSSHLDLLAGHC